MKINFNKLKDQGFHINEIDMGEFEITMETDSSPAMEKLASELSDRLTDIQVEQVLEATFKEIEAHCIFNALKGA